MDPAAIIAIAAAILSPVGAFLVASRKMSGRIDTTDADKLWQEASDIRADYRDRVLACQDENARLRNELATARSEVATLRMELATSRNDLAGARNELADERNEIASLKHQIAELSEERNG